MNSNPTSYVQTVDSVMIFIISVSVVLLLGITATMIYFVFKFNRKKGNKPVDIHGSLLLETIWFVIPLILVMSMFYYGFIGFKELKAIPGDTFEVNVTARMWNWEFNYENGKKTDSLYVPIGKTIKLNMISADVNHSFYVPAFRIKQDVIGGTIKNLIFKPEKEGKYNVACAEYCGLKHSMMYTKVIVMSEEKFNDWYSQNISEEKQI